MILAAAECGEWRTSSRTPAPTPPPELRLAMQARTYTALPYAGALMDQPAGLLDRMAACINVYDAFRSYGQMKPGTKADWIERHPTYWETIQQVRKLRENVQG